MREHATALADAVDAALPAWVERSVRRALASNGRSPDRDLLEATARAGQAARQEIGPQLRALLAADIDEQRSTPLSLLRAAVRFPTEVLEAAAVVPPHRDPEQVRLFPDDIYDLSPATFADFGPEVGEKGLAWAAAKAFAHKRRHGPKEVRT